MAAALANGRAGVLDPVALPCPAAARSPRPGAAPKPGESLMSDDSASPPPVRRSRPGRPEGRGNHREAVLDAAERTFAERGFAGASYREIAAEAAVTQAMITYYFGSKPDLFREVYLRRGRQLAGERMALLEALQAREAPFSVEDVVRAYLVPPFGLVTSTGGRAFLRLQARLHAEPDEMAFGLRREVYDAPVRAFVTVLAGLLPHLPADVLYRRFAQIIGIYLYILSDAHRIGEISAGAAAMPATETMIAEIVAFTAAGLRAQSAA